MPVKGPATVPVAPNMAAPAAPSMAVPVTPRVAAPAALRMAAPAAPVADAGPDRNAPVPWLRAGLRATLRRFFPGQQVSDEPAWIWLWAGFEAVLFCVAALVVSFWLTPADPFGLRAEFPWLWIVPAVLAMRYGSVIAMLAVSTLFTGWLAMEQLQLVTAVFPKAYFLGGLILALVCGQFADVWNSRQRRLRAVNAYLDERLNTLTKSHFLLRLSHERLEQDLLAKPLTLRETLTRLRGLSGRDLGEAMPGAAEFLQLLGQTCQLEVASVFAQRGDGSIDPHAVAQVGPASALDLNDPLMAFGIEQGDLVHVQMAEPGARDFDLSRYMVCSPMTTSSGQRIGLVAVERVPFFALNYDTLQLFAVLLGYYADGVDASRETRALIARVPGCPQDFALDLVRLSRIRDTAEIQSALVALVFEDDERGADMHAQVMRQRRNMDLSWEMRSPGRITQLTLLPLAGAAAVEGYLVRIESALHAQFGVGFMDARVAAHNAHLGAAPPADTLRALIGRCHD